MTKLKIDYSEARDWYIKGDKEKEGIKYPSLPDIAREFEYSLSTLRKKAANEGWFKKYLLLRAYTRSDNKDQVHSDTNTNNRHSINQAS